MADLPGQLRLSATRPGDRCAVIPRVSRPIPRVTFRIGRTLEVMIGQVDRRGPDAARRRAVSSKAANAAVPAPGPGSAGRGARPVPWWTLPLLGLAGFLVLLWQVATHGPLATMDVHVRAHIRTWAASSSLTWLGAPGRAVPNLGDPLVAIPVLAVVALFAAWRSRSLLPPAVAAGTLLVLATVIPLKIWVGRPGPGTDVLTGGSLGYFPSGHTADATLCYGAAALILCEMVLTGRPARRGAAALAAVLIALTAFGLLWSDYHWLSDILGSLCWGGAALAVLHRLTDAARARPQPSPPQNTRREGEQPHEEHR
jgi:undecaprenyl-diphosphatase